MTRKCTHPGCELVFTDFDSKSQYCPEHRKKKYTSIRARLRPGYIRPDVGNHSKKYYQFADNFIKYSPFTP
jgi:hypothetical protein